MSLIDVIEAALSPYITIQRPIDGIEIFIPETLFFWPEGTVVPGYSDRLYGKTVLCRVYYGTECRLEVTATLGPPATMIDIQNIDDDDAVCLSLRISVDQARRFIFDMINWVNPARVTISSL